MSSDPHDESNQIASTYDNSASADCDAFTSEYHCTAEWHFSRMRSKYVALVYGLALRLSLKSQMFYASQIRLADYFGTSRRTIWAAVHELELASFFVRLSRSQFRTTVFNPLDHSTWAKHHPGKCATKIEMPWSAEGSALGRELHAISGGRVKFRPQQIEYLQSNFTDEEIKSGFTKLKAQGGVMVDQNGFLHSKNINWEKLCCDE